MSHDADSISRGFKRVYDSLSTIAGRGDNHLRNSITSEAVSASSELWVVEQSHPIHDIDKRIALVMMLLVVSLALATEI